MAGGLARHGIHSVAAAPLAAHALAVLWDHGYVQATADRVVEAAEAYLVHHKDKIQTPSTARASWWAGRWMDRLLVDRALDGLCLIVRDMRGPDHPWRAELRAAVRKLILELATDRERFARGEAIKADLVKNPALIKYVRDVWAGIEADLRSSDLAHTEAISESLEYALLGLGKWLEQDMREQAVLNRWVRRVVRNAVLPRRAAIADYIAEVVSSWETDAMIDKLQLEVGRDLQYIRINGTLVGGLVGLLIFTAARQFGLL